MGGWKTRFSERSHQINIIREQKPVQIRNVQFNPTVGDIKGNTQHIINHIQKAEKDGIQLILFPELSVCGYPPMDLLERKDFIKRTEDAIKKIAASTNENVVAIFGAPVRNEVTKGRPLFNAAIVVNDGRVQNTIFKTLLPTYDVFDEFRYFEQNTVFKPVDINGISVGITICEDLWNNENEIEYHTYSINPADELKKAGAQIIVNISASPFTIKKPELRVAMLQNHAKSLRLPILYSNQVGANTEILFDGDSLAVNSDGTVLGRQALFSEGYVDFLYDDAKLTTNKENASATGKEERIFRALVCGLRDYMEKTKISKEVVLGLSGGIDSALVAVIAAEAAGAKHVHAVTMPSRFSSEGSVSDSAILAKNLGIQFDEIPVKNVYDSFIETLAPSFKGLEFGVAEENLQSRSRGVILMALSNKFGYLLLNTGNKSEMAVGYCTLYGDMAGGLSVLSDVYKTEVYAVCRWLNAEYFKKEVIPEAILTKPPSAELRPDQKDTDSLPDYEILDTILRMYIENQSSLAEVAEKIGDETLARRILRMVDFNEYKRRQAAPGLRVSAKAFGFGRRLPIAQQWTSQH